MTELTNLGRYELRRVLGKGAMGVVYEGFDPGLNRPVAVKTILKSVVTDEETAAAYSARFAREAKAAGRLSHANIVQVYDFGEQNDVAYLVMEFIEGRELRNCFEARERFDAAESVRIMGELLEALHFAHEAGVIHRDVKPANVMLDVQRRVKLADFGVARIQDGTDRSRAGTIVGTPAFMSPEQITGGRVDRRTDVFSAGIILYQLLTGEQPFTGDGGVWTVVKRIMQDEPPRPSTIAARVSPAFDQIVNRALAKKPDQRFASARDFATALKAALAGDGAAGSQRGGDAEIEFWRSIQNSNDPAEFEVYLKEFPAGVYADLARIKIAKLPRVAAGPSEAIPAPAPPPARDSREVLKLAEETSRLEAEIARREAEFRRREAETQAMRQAEEQARAAAEAKLAAEAAAHAAEEERARLTAIEAAKQDAKLALAKREAEYRKREAEAVASAEAEARARRAAEEKAGKDAEARAKAEAEAKARDEAEVKARRKAEAKVRAESEARAAAKARQDAEQQAKRDAQIAKREAELQRREAAGPRKQAPVVEIVVATVVILAALFGAYYWTISSDQARLATLTAALDAATKATDELNLARQRQDELEKQVEVARLAEDDARAKGDQAKLKELQEQTKQAEVEAQKQDELVKRREAEAKKAEIAAKLAESGKLTDTAKAVEKAAQEKAAKEKLAQEKADQEKATAEKLAADKAAAEKASIEKATADKLAAERISAEKRAADKAAAARAAAAAAKPGWPSVGDRWIYYARISSAPPREYRYGIEVLQVASAEVRDRTTLPGGRSFEQSHRAGAYISGGTGAREIFSPYLRAFQELNEGQRWSNIAIVGTAWTGSDFTCSMDARIAGKEKVTVRAGTFEATKIVVQAECQSVWRKFWTLEYTYWFADGAKRFVKHQSRYITQSPPPLTPDQVTELVSYTPAVPSAAEKSAASEKTSTDGVQPGQYAFRIMTGTGSGSMCDLNGLEEDIEIRAGAPQAISGQQFSNLQLRSAADGSIAGRVFDESNRRIAGEIALTGRAAADGYAGTYSGRYQNFACTGQWTLVRKGN